MSFFTSKNIVVCGGSKGIGACIARAFLEAEGIVTVISRSHPEYSHKNLQHIQCDLTNVEEIDALSNKIKTISPDILINNTGGPAPNDPFSIDYAEILKGVNAHFYASQKLTESVIDNMKNTEYGRIINIVSISGIMPVKDLSVSNFLRGGILTWAKNLANILAPTGVTVNSILPGYTDTQRLRSIIENRALKNNTTKEMEQKNIENTIPMKKFGSPEDLAQLALFLSGPYASYITGQTIACDGGTIPCV